MRNRILLHAFVFLFLSYGSISAQLASSKDRCEALTKNVHDPKTGVTRIISEHEIRINDLGGKGLYQIVLMRSHEDYSFIIRSIKRECYARDTKVTFFFRSGRKIQFVSNNKENCESSLLVSMGGIFGNTDKIESFLNDFLIGIQFDAADRDTYRLKIETPNTEHIQEIFECFATAYE